MTCSMTAFAREEHLAEGGVISCEIKTVNHRYLDLSLRLAEVVRPLEAAVTERVRERLARGKVECTIGVQHPDAALSLKVDDGPLAALAREMVRTENRLRDMGVTLTPPSVLDVMKWRHITDFTTPTPVDPSQVGDDTLNLLDQTLDSLVRSRQEEGGRLEEVIRGHCDQFAGIIAQLRGRYPSVLAAAREKLEQKLAGIDTDFDPQRMVQEAALLAHKFYIGADIAEELDRCDSHIKELDAVFRRTGPVGRRLDFLMQEMNREINTIASKSVDAAMAHTAVDAKTLVEQMREQIQNIE